MKLKRNFGGVPVIALAGVAALLMTTPDSLGKPARHTKSKGATIVNRNLSAFCASYFSATDATKKRLGRKAVKCTRLFVAQAATSAPVGPVKNSDGSDYKEYKGGKGGASGGEVADEASVDPAFLNFCSDYVLKQGRLERSGFDPDECALYIMELRHLGHPLGYPPRSHESAAGRGPDGPPGVSIEHGIGGKGGKGGIGPNGGAGGAGGAGIDRGNGGAGGAGGRSD